MACCVLMGLALAAIVVALKAGSKLLGINLDFDVADQLEWKPESSNKTQGSTKQ